MRARLHAAPGSDVPVICQPFDPSDAVPYWAGGGFQGDLLYDRAECDEAGKVVDRSAGPERDEMAELLREALLAVEAPDDQLSRLELT